MADRLRIGVIGANPTQSWAKRGHLPAILALPEELELVAVCTTREETADVRLNPDGSFVGFVPVREGRNRVLVNALASDGSRGSTEFDITFKYQEMTDAELQAELERVRKRNREIQLIMEQKRQEAFRKLERERMVEIEVEVEDENEEQDPGE